jgi:hypothetical protein
MALTQVKAAGLASDLIDETKLADDSIDSEHYNDGSIDHAHLANDCVDGDNIADDAINSEHYVDGSIDHAHLAADCIDGDNVQDDVINSEHIAAGAVDLEHMASESVDEDNLKISNAGSNGQYLQKQSGNTGGLTWAAVSGGGIEEIDCWRLSASIQHSSNETWFTSNWERQDNPTGGASKLGTGITESSGIFTFPSTGFWLMYAHWRFYNTGAEPEYHGYLQTSTNPSTFDGYFPLDTVGSFTDGTGTNTGTCTGVHVFDVTNTTNYKVRIGAYASSTSTYTNGHNNQNMTYVYFIKLADT